MNAKELLNQDKISYGHYKTYLLFEENEEGREWLKKMIECSFQERVPPAGEYMYAWQDGRLSLLRDIKMMIDQVKKLTEKNNDDRN